MSVNSIRAMDDVLAPIDEAGMTSCFSLSRLEIIVCYNEKSLFFVQIGLFLFLLLCVMCVFMYVWMCVYMCW